jgi:hypothetical protein
MSKPIKSYMVPHIPPKGLQMVRYASLYARCVKHRLQKGGYTGPPLQNYFTFPSTHPRTLASILILQSSLSNLRSYRVVVCE